MRLILSVSKNSLLDLSPFLSVGVTERNGRWVLVGTMLAQGGAGATLAFFADENAAKGAWESITDELANGKMFANINYFTIRPTEQDMIALGLGSPESGSISVVTIEAPGFDFNRLQPYIGKTLAEVSAAGESGVNLMFL